MSIVPETGVTQIVEDSHRKPLTAARIDTLFTSLSKRLTKNPKYRLPGNSEPFQTTIVVNGGAVFVKLLKSRQTTRDIDFIAAYTDALLEDNGLEDPIVFLCQEISVIGMEEGLGNTWMNYEGDGIIQQIGERVTFDNDEEIDVIKVIGDKSVAQEVILYEDPGLKVYAMDWCWALCFKLTRFTAQDKIDIVALLLHLGVLPPAGGQGAVELWNWIRQSCPLQVADWQVRHLEETVKGNILEIMANT